MMNMIVNNDIDATVNAVRTLDRIGRQRFRKESQSQMTDADTIAMGLVMGTAGHIDALNLAANILEEINNHLLAAILRQISDGKMSRRGRKVTITLPDYIV